MADVPLKFRMLTGNVELLDDAILYREEQYAYTAITHLGRFARKTSVNFLPLGNYVRITILIENRSKPIKLANTGGFPGTTSRLEVAYRILVEKTFDKRLSSYIDQLNGVGYFTYSGANFFPSGDVKVGDKKISLTNSKIVLEPFRIILKPKTSIFARAIKIDTEFDQDIFLSLLDHIYNISFT